MLRKFVKGFRQLVRDNTREIPLEKARRRYRTLSFFYFFFAWNAAFTVAYFVRKQRKEAEKNPFSEKIPKGLSTAKMMNVPNARVIRMEGLRKTGEYEIKEYEIVNSEKNV